MRFPLSCSQGGNLNILGTFILILISPVLAFAESDSYCQNLAEELLPVFQQTAEREYRQLMCTDNVKKLGQSLREFGFEIPTLAVVIRHPQPAYVPVLPQKAKLNYKGKTYLKPKWSQHGILIVQGLVLDMDYTEELQIVGLKKFMDTMWDPVDLKQYMIQSKDSRDFTGRDLYGYVDEALYPKTPALEWIEKQSSSPCFNY